MKILVVGGGGREHALVYAIWASPLCDALYCAPGNAGIAEHATCVPIAAEDVGGILAFAKAEKIDFVVVGPEAPLAAGLIDRLEEAGIKAFGPSAAAARLESSKIFMKEMCRKYGIPTAAGESFEDFEKARKFIEARNQPFVVKLDGLAAGKGVAVNETVAETTASAKSTLQLGPIVLEERLEGEEVSFFALVDGEHALALASAQDHKRIGEGDTGVNTGGMGAYSPAPVMTAEMEARVMKEIIAPTVRGMAAEGTLFKGVLFAGLMITKDGPKLLEFNVRFGDPECQVLIPRLKSDLLPALLATRDGVLSHFDLRWRDEAALCVVMAARGYPDTYKKGTEIKGLEKAGEVPGVTVFHAGTRAEGGKILANGGRVLGVTALGADIGEAQKRAYEAVARIAWEDAYFRRDIGWRALMKTKT
jgi:phosphoribosylamine--glycine ligase